MARSAFQGVKVDGLREAIDHLAELNPNLRRRFGNALKRAGAITLARARSEAPVHTGRLSGDLTLRTRTSSRGIAGVAVGAVNPYIGVILFGRQAPHGGHGHRNPHIRTLTPNRFLMRAFTQTRPALVRLVDAEIKAALEETFDGS